MFLTRNLENLSILDEQPAGKDSECYFSVLDNTGIHFLSLVNIFAQTKRVNVSACLVGNCTYFTTIVSFGPTVADCFFMIELHSYDNNMCFFLLRS